MQWLDERLRSGGYPTAAGFVSQFEVSRRTFYRDIEYMRLMLGAPIAYDLRRRGYYYEDKTFNLAAVQLTEGELVALLVAEHVLRQYRGTPYGGDLERAFGKICRSLSDMVTVDFRCYEKSITFDPGPLRSPDIGVFNVVSDALRNRKELQIRYHTQSRDQDSVRRIDPYHLHNYRGDWYLVAFCHLRGEVRDFLLARILEAAPTGRFFEVFPDFDAREYISRGFGIEKGERPLNIAIRFDSYQARWIRERLWHPTQRVEEHQDGSITLHLRTTGLGEIARWVMSYGRHAVVLRPSRLRRMVIGELKEGIENYGLDEG
jgi:predicted DNA-binding transcriptional regulator YafY